MLCCEIFCYVYRIGNTLAWQLPRVLLIKFRIDMLHPVGKHLQGFIDERFGHLAIVSISHRTWNSSESVGIAAECDGEFYAIHIVLACKETDDGRTPGARWSGVEGEFVMNVFVTLARPVGIVFVKKFRSDKLFWLVHSQFVTEVLICAKILQYSCSFSKFTIDYFIWICRWIV